MLLLPAACAVALAFGGNALAAYNPSLLVANTTHATGSGGPVIIGVGQDQNDDATGVITIYAPRGYGVTLGQSPGTKIGDLEGIVFVRALQARVEITGTVTARDPAQYVNNPCSPGLHNAVWTIDTTLAGTALQIPLYIDAITTGPEAAFASFRLRVCLASPYVPPPQGAASGASLIVAAFSVQGVFRNPSTRGRYPWNALFIPYTPGTASLNPGNAAQSTSYTAVPVGLTVRTRKLRRGKRRFARVTVCVTEAGQPVRGVSVNVLAGRSARRLGRVRRVRTNARGCATTLVRLRFRVTFFRASMSIPDRNVTASPGCSPPLSVAPGAPNARCSSASYSPVIGPAFSRTLRVRRR